MSEALVPMDLDAEARVVGGLFLQPEDTGELMLKLTPDNFHSSKCRWMYEAICGLHIGGNPITPETVASVLGTKSELGKPRLELIGGAGAIIETMEGLNGGENFFWADVVRKKFEERQLLNFAEDVRRAALSNPESISGIRNELESKLVGLGSSKVGNSTSIANTSIALDERIQRYIDHPDEIVGMPTTFGRLDRELDGLQPGNVTIVYAPSSRYKSLFVANIGWRLAQQNYPGLWFTTEMPTVQVTERILQLESGLNLKWLRRDKEVYSHRKLIKEAQIRMAEYPIYFCDTSALDVTEVRADVSRHVRWNKIDYIIVDLVDHISSSRFKDEMTNNQRVVMASMKQIAKDFNIHVILVSHITKQPKESRSSADLDVEAMNGSGAKYQDVDAAISIGPVKKSYNTDLGTYKWVAMEREDIQKAMFNGGIIEVMVALTKNRHGELIRDIMEVDFKHGGRFGYFSVRNSPEDIIKRTGAEVQAVWKPEDMDSAS